MPLHPFFRALAVRLVALQEAIRIKLPDVVSDAGAVDAALALLLELNGVQGSTLESRVNEFLSVGRSESSGDCDPKSVATNLSEMIAGDDTEGLWIALMRAKEFGLPTATAELRLKEMIEGRLWAARLSGSFNQLRDAVGFASRLGINNHDASLALQQMAKDAFQAAVSGISVARDRAIEVGVSIAELEDLVVATVVATNAAKAAELDFKKKKASEALETARQQLAEQRQREKELSEATRRALKDAGHVRRQGKRTSGGGAKEAPAKRQAQ